ncbi:MAG: nitrilase-related carbon-nitrogen hydrolase [Eubacteriales bacterium]|jgi:hypothetical protein
MARYVKLSAINTLRLPQDDGHDLEAALNTAIEHLDRALADVLPDRPDLIALPEAFDRYPSHNEAAMLAYYELRRDRVRDHLMKVARDNGVNIAYNYGPIYPDGTKRNQTVFISRTGGIDGFYNKNHLVDTENTVENMLFGKDAPIIKTDFGKVAGVICFDLNYDELREKYMKNHPELIVFSSQYHGGDFLQSYWAYSCRSWFLGAVFQNECALVNPLGTKIAHSTNYFPYFTATANLDYAIVHLAYNWEKLDAARRKYGSGVKVYDPGNVGAVLITSECDEFSAMDIIREFDIMLLDDYFAKSMAHRHAPGMIEP